MNKHLRTHTIMVLLSLLPSCSSQPPAPVVLPPSTVPVATPAATNTAGAVGVQTTSGASGQLAAAGMAGQTVTPNIPVSGPDAGIDEADGGSPQADGGSPQAGGTVDVRATGPGDWRAGDYPPDLKSANYLELSGIPGQNGHTRQYKVHVPPSYDASKPTPLVFCIHGLGQDPIMFCLTGAALDQKSDLAGYILVMPNGYQNSWNAGTCCGAASNEKLDDVTLFRTIFAEVSKHLNIDLDRVYATGLSNGGYMSYRLACEAADLIRGAAPGAGAIGINDIGGGTNAASDFVTCTPSKPVSILDVHGTADPLIPYALQAKSLELIAKQNGCSTQTVPAPAPKSAGDTTCVTYQGCPTGIEVTGCTIANGGHCWFASPDCGTGGGAIGLAFVGANSDTMDNSAAVTDFFSRNAH
jgi:polyhydroxybutyrate depolymerase